MAQMVETDTICTLKVVEVQGAYFTRKPLTLKNTEDRLQEFQVYGVYWPTVVAYSKWRCRKKAFYVISEKEEGRNKRHTAMTNIM